MNEKISFFHDTRTKKKNEKYPIKLRVYSKELQLKKLYSIGNLNKDNNKFEVIDYTKDEFKSIVMTVKPRKEHLAVRELLDTYLQKAKSICSQIHPFTFEAFEDKYYQRKVDIDTDNVFNLYDSLIGDLKDEGRIGTADSYDCSKKKLSGYVTYLKGAKETQFLSIRDITPGFLKKYENYLLNHKSEKSDTIKKTSNTTIGIYMRALRVVFNFAISKNYVSIENYPFTRNNNDKGKYTIPTGVNIKKALTKDELKRLFESVPLTPEQEKAKDFFFFSYTGNGMNIADVVNLRYENIKGDSFYFIREKTKHTTRGNPQPIQVYINDYIKEIIQKYGNANKKPKQLIFDICKDSYTPEQNHIAKQNFVRYINQHLKLLAASVGLTENIGTYYARHSFATNVITEHGASMEFVSKALGHTSQRTTDKYFSTFPDATKKHIAENLMSF